MIIRYNTIFIRDFLKSGLYKMFEMMNRVRSIDTSPLKGFPFQLLLSSRPFMTSHGSFFLTLCRVSLIWKLKKKYANLSFAINESKKANCTRAIRFYSLIKL